MKIVNLLRSKLERFSSQLRGLSSPRKLILLSSILILAVVILFKGYQQIYSPSNYQSSISEPIISPTSTTNSPSPTPELKEEASQSTASWRIYTNSKYGFSISYPSNWIEKTSSAGVTFDENNRERSFSPKKVEIRVYENVGNLSPLEFMDQIFYKELKQSSYQLVKVYLEEYRNNQDKYFKPVQIGNHQATKITVLIVPSGSLGEGVWIMNNNGGIFIVNQNNVDYENSQKLFDQMLSTFKFTQ